MIQITLILTNLLVALVAGFVLAFSTVVMPGLTQLEDRDFLRSFQVIDSTIQRAQPIFIIVWLGSLISVLALSLLSLHTTEASMRWLILGSTLIFILGVHFPTISKNVPLNNQLKSVSIESADEEIISKFKKQFDEIWIPWNHRRTIASVVSFLLFLICLFKI